MFFLYSSFPCTRSSSKGPLNEHEMISYELETSSDYGPYEDTLNSSSQK